MTADSSFSRRKDADHGVLTDARRAGSRRKASLRLRVKQSDPRPGTVSGIDDDLHMIKELTWVVGRVVEVLGSIVAGIIGYFLLINDPDFPATPPQELYVWGAFVLFASLAVVGAWLTRLADRPDSPDRREASGESVPASVAEGPPPASARRLLPLVGAVLVTISLSWVVDNARKRRFG